MSHAGIAENTYFRKSIYIAHKTELPRNVNDPHLQACADICIRIRMCLLPSVQL